MENSNTLQKIEVGDTVIFRTDLKVGKRYGQIDYIDGMLQSQQVVEKVYDTGSFDVIGSIYFMSPEMVAQVIKPTKERVYTEQEMFDFANSYADNVMGGMIKTPSEYFSEYIESLNK